MPRMMAEIIEELADVKGKVEAITNKLDYSQSKSDRIDINEVSRITGYKVSTIYQMTCRDDIPCHRQEDRRKLFFSRKEIELWVKGKQQNNEK